jgi:hypothetical protein
MGCSFSILQTNVAGPSNERLNRAKHGLDRNRWHGFALAETASTTGITGYGQRAQEKSHHDG